MIDTLANIFLKDTIIPFNDSERSLTIKEAGPEAKVNKVKIQGFQNNPIAVCTDKIDFKIEPYLKNTKGVDKRCDALVIYKKELEIYVLFIELKSDQVKNTEIIQKMNASRALLEYIFSIILRFNKNTIPSIKPKYSYIVFSTDKHKRPISYKKQGIYTRPPLALNSEEKVLFYNARRGITYQTHHINSLLKQTS